MRVVINTVKRTMMGNPNNPKPDYSIIGDMFISMIGLSALTYLIFQKTTK